MRIQDKSPKTTYYLNEGDFEMFNKKVLTPLGASEGGYFVNQMEKDTFVELDTESDITVKKATKRAFGITRSDAEGNFPMKNTNYEDLNELRRATVDVFVPGNLFNLPLSDTNAVIKPNDYLTIKNGKLDKATGSVNTGAKATKGKVANNGGDIEVLITDPEGIQVTPSSS